MLGIHTEVGNFREVNQDYVGYKSWKQGGIYVVADGMGGYAGGEVASELAVETLLKCFEERDVSRIHRDQLRAFIEVCNEKIFHKALKDTELKGMGTTITFSFVNDGKCIVGNIGDSCCFMLRKNELKKITKDHSLVQAFVDSGSLTEEEAKNHPNKNIITRSLGTSESVECDFYEFVINSDDIILLCSDGLSNHISGEYMKETLVKYKGNEAVKVLSEKSKINGSRDNISVMVFKGECQDDR